MADTWTRKVWLAAAREAAARGEPELTQARFAEIADVPFSKVRLWVTKGDPSHKYEPKIRKAFLRAVAEVEGTPAPPAPVSDPAATVGSADRSEFFLGAAVGRQTASLTDKQRTEIYAAAEQLRGQPIANQAAAEQLVRGLIAGFLAGQGRGSR